MRRFEVSFFNHFGFHGIHVEDVVLHLRNGLRAAGQDAFLSPALLGNDTTVVLECFTREQAAHLVEVKQTTGKGLVIVASEPTDGHSFNTHIQSGGSHYDDRQQWQERFDNFMVAAGFADGIWCLAKQLVPQYQSLLPGKPVLEFPYAFDPHFPAVFHPPEEAKDVDVLFTGNMTPYREAVLAEFLARGLKILTAPVVTPTLARMDLIVRAKTALHINLSDSRVYPSPMRHHFLLMCGVSVLSEQAQTSGPLDEFILQFPSTDFVDGVCDFIASGRWRNEGLLTRERYRQDRPMAQPMLKLLAETFG